MHITVITLFPELFEAFGRTSLIGRACKHGTLTLTLHDLRPHGLGRHKSVDDTPYGGGSGMVMRVDCLVEALEGARAALPDPGVCERVLLTPQGVPFSQSMAAELAEKQALLLLCGRYEGFDDRVHHFADREVSLGDFVLNGGEVAAMALIEAVVRLLPGVLGNEASATSESFSSALGGSLEYPQFTRPVEFRGHAVPEVLLSGDHGKIAEWRKAQAEDRTRARRPELLAAKGKGT